MLLCECRYSSLTLCDVCDYSQSPRHCDQLITHSVCHPLSSPSEASGSVEASGLTLFASCVSPIRGDARALRIRVRLSRLSLSGRANLSSPSASLRASLRALAPRSRASAHLSHSLSPPLRRGSARLQTHVRPRQNH